MREAAQRPVTGPAGVDCLAASGGLDVPGRRPQVPRQSGLHTEPEPIPGERDRSTLTGRQPGAIGGRPSGADTPSSEPDVLMDAATVHDRVLEGGGEDSEIDDR